MKVKFAKLDELAVSPKTAKAGDAGFDLTAISRTFISEGEVSYWNYDFGLAVEIPEGYVGLLFPRSSISKKNLMLTNCVGVVDSGYRGPLSARFKTVKPSTNMPIVFEVGDRVAQLVIIPYLQAEFEEVSYKDLTETERGNGGFGSSGK